MAPLCEWIANLFRVQLTATNMVKSSSFNPLWTVITTMFQEKSSTNHISEPTIRRFFSPNLCYFVHLGAVLWSFIHSALKITAATLRRVLAPLSLSHVTDSFSLFISFLIFFFLSWFYINYSGRVFNKTSILLGLAGYGMIITNSALRASLVIYHPISSAPS